MLLVTICVMSILDSKFSLPEWDTCLQIDKQKGLLECGQIIRGRIRYDHRISK
jgi:hypothetical protein